MRSNEYYDAIQRTAKLYEQYIESSKRMEELQQRYAHKILNQFRSDFNVPPEEEVNFVFSRVNKLVLIVRKIKANRLSAAHIMQNTCFTIRDIEGREINHASAYTITYLWNPNANTTT